MMGKQTAVLYALFCTLLFAFPVTADCFTSVIQIPWNCTGGEMLTEPFPSGGCRTLQCVTLEDSMQVLACDKTEDNVSFFEMYKQNQTGNTSFEICLDTTCISDAGYVRGPNFPICDNGTNETPPVNGTPINETPFVIGVDETAPTSDVLLMIDIANAIQNTEGANPIAEGTAILFKDIHLLNGKVTIAIWNGSIVIIDGGSNGNYTPFITYVSTILDGMNPSHGINITHTVIPSSDVPNADLRAYFNITTTQPPICTSILVGDAYRINTGSDKVELREPIGNVVDTITGSDLVSLKSGRITTALGATDYHQYLRLNDGSSLGDTSVNFVENNEGTLADYLIIDTREPFFEWELQFPDGLQSRRDLDTGELMDLEDRIFNIMGIDYTIVHATENANHVIMTLLGSAIPDTLREGETKTYTINGVDYEVTLILVSDANEGGMPQAKFSVNGEITPLLAPGDSNTLSGGQQIGVRDILINTREGVASFFLFADKIVIADPDSQTGDWAGAVELNNEYISGGEADIWGQESDNNFMITSIRYRARLNASNDMLYIPSGAGVRDDITNPTVLLSNALDFRYEGLTSHTDGVALTSALDSSTYILTFTNIANYTIALPLLSNIDGNWKYGYTDDIIFVEGLNTSDYTIGLSDYIIVGDSRGAADADKSVTNVLRYIAYNATQRTITFEDQRFQTLENNSTTEFGTFDVLVSDAGIGHIIIGSHTHEIRVSDVNTEAPQLAVDLNADGDIANDVMTITTLGGGILDIASAVEITNTSTLTSANGALLTQFVRDGATLELDASHDTQTVNLTLRMLAKNFDSSGDGDELLTWTVGENGANGITLNFTEYHGPQTGNMPGVQGVFDLYPYQADYLVGMTDWGTLVEQHVGAGNPPELYMFVPKVQRFAQVFVTFSSLETTCVNASVCGNGIKDGDEQCDDGNTVSGDHCSSTCTVESFCGDHIVNAGETCVSCPADVGACAVQRSGGGGGGGGFIPPRKNQTNSTPVKVPVDAPNDGVGKAPQTTTSEGSAANSEEKELTATAESTPVTTSQNAPKENLVTGAFLGIGQQNWLYFTIATALIAAMLGVYSWRRTKA